jgi:hypothetical protein
VLVDRIYPGDSIFLGDKFVESWKAALRIANCGHFIVLILKRSTIANSEHFLGTQSVLRPLDMHCSPLNNHGASLSLPKSPHPSVGHAWLLLRRFQMPISFVFPLIGESEKLHDAVVPTPRRCSSESGRSNLLWSLQKSSRLDICTHSR